ncbi:helix-turn-helix domain-containing protein [Hymenobacter sp. NBH84]|uniref:helix-turn-helix transcriptional regulator n=1 Tax=Hymenobacter sp. NBH84 TaxID=2596915 RepID=UPI0016274427|nr:helix-turn-helix domain-containing protein [Hymenobacter sp. NBH84]QNE38596.1 helix-turn-helix domain-containing protein [Hymenobacter sp. NBH84]
MNANDIATKGDLEALLLKMQQLLQTTLPAPALPDDYLTIDEVAELTRFNRKTVAKWISEGKYDQRGKLIHLFTLEFAPGKPHIPRSALIAFGQAIGFDTKQLTQPPPLRLAS